MALEETSTNMTAQISETNLNAMLLNEGIELKIELDNSREDGDLWKNGLILVEMPQEIETIEIVDVQTLHQDTIEETKANVIEYNGKKAIQINLIGEQKHFITDNLENGTTIILTLNIALKELTPNKADNELNVYYHNDNTIRYQAEEIEIIKLENEEYNCGKIPLKINYTSPQIVYNIQKIKGYDEEKVLVSSSETVKTETIGIREAEKEITVENIVLNNTECEITNVKVLGKIPSKDNTHLDTLENLGNTLNTTLKEQIQKQEKMAHIYYTTNPNPTTDINVIENNWTETIEDINSIKAYLIIIEKLEKGERLDFAYKIKIPAELEHCEYMYLTNGVYYTSTTELGAVEAKAIPTKIGLTTGEGAVLEIMQEVSVGDQVVVNEGQILRYEITIKNVGKLDAKGVVATSQIPKWSSFVQENIVDTSTNKYTQYNYYSSSNILLWNVGEIKAGESKELEFYLEVNKIPTIIEYYGQNENFIKEDGKYYLNEIDEETGETKKVEITQLPPIVIESNTTVSCENMSKDLTSNTTKNPVTKAYFKISEESSIDKNTYLNEGETIIYTIAIENNTDLERKNVKISKILPEGVTYKSAKLLNRNEEVHYNNETREVLAVLQNLAAKDIVILKVEVTIDKLQEEEYQKEIKTNTTITEDEKTVTSSEVINNVGKPKIVTTVTYDVTQKNIYEGDTINITITATNEEIQTAGNLKISQAINNNFKFVDGSMEIGAMKTSITYDGQGTVYAATNLKKGETVTIKLNLKAADLPKGVDIQEVTTITTIEAFNILQQEISRKTYVVEKTVENKKEEAEENGDIDVDEEGNITFKIQGQVWHDEDRNGEKTNNEKLFPNIIVYLLKEGKLVTQTTTDQSGIYEFKGLNGGKYLVAFDYNQEIYEPTIYQKEGIISDNNSDVIMSMVNIDGMTGTKAVTNEINIQNRNIYCIDMGLVTKQKFDLKLETKVSKITLSTKTGIKTYEFNNVGLAKVEIKASEVNGATALIEYTIKVTNVGDLPGTASQILNYNNNMLNFSSDINKNWYQASDGNYYTNELQNITIHPGETKEIKLTLSRELNGNRTGIIDNKTAISKIYNDKNLEDKDISNNETIAQCLLVIATGAEKTYTIAIILLALTGLIGGSYISLKKIRGKERKEIFK